MRDETLEAYRCPVTGTALELVPNSGLQSLDGHVYPFLAGDAVPDFVPRENALDLYSKFDAETAAKLDYSTAEQVSVYQNEIDWIMKTFGADEDAVRRDLGDRLGLQRGDKLLVVGCGQGVELTFYFESVGSEGRVFAQDISAAMIEFARSLPANSGVEFSVSDACSLPFPDNYFDRVIQVGAINQFGDVKAAIAEMSRVTRIGGRVLICDEGIAPHLHETEYGRKFINNNPLWNTPVPLADLPETAGNINLGFVLGHCFYVITFDRCSSTPPVDWTVPHLGRRGGTIETRYSGQLEGVTPGTKSRVIEAASEAGLPVHDWLETALNDALNRE